VLLWSDSQRDKVQVSFSPSAKSGWNAWWERSSFSNDFVGQSTQADTTAVAAWAQLGSKLVGNASVLWQNFDLSGLGGFNPGLTSDARAFTLGGSYQYDPRTAVNATYAWAKSVDATSLRQNTFTFDIRHDIGRRDRCALGVTLDRLHDTGGTGLGYTADVYRAQYTREF
jgi:hypothetical protein